MVVAWAPHSLHSAAPWHLAPKPLHSASGPLSCPLGTLSLIFPDHIRLLSHFRGMKTALNKRFRASVLSSPKGSRIQAVLPAGDEGKTMVTIQGVQEHRLLVTQSICAEEGGQTWLELRLLSGSCHRNCSLSSALLNHTVGLPLGSWKFQVVGFVSVHVTSEQVQPYWIVCLFQALGLDQMKESVLRPGKTGWLWVSYFTFLCGFLVWFSRVLMKIN